MLEMKPQPAADGAPNTIKNAILLSRTHIHVVEGGAY